MGLSSIRGRADLDFSPPSQRRRAHPRRLFSLSGAGVTSGPPATAAFPPAYGVVCSALTISSSSIRGRADSEGCPSVLRRRLVGAIDHQYLQRCFLGVELQAQALLQSLENRGDGGAGVR